MTQIRVILLISFVCWASSGIGKPDLNFYLPMSLYGEPRLGPKACNPQNPSANAKCKEVGPVRTIVVQIVIPWNSDKYEFLVTGSLALGPDMPATKTSASNSSNRICTNNDTDDLNSLSKTKRNRYNVNRTCRVNFVNNNSTSKIYSATITFNRKTNFDRYFGVHTFSVQNAVKSVQLFAVNLPSDGNDSRLRIIEDGTGKLKLKFDLGTSNPDFRYHTNHSSHPENTALWYIEWKTKENKTKLDLFSKENNSTDEFQNHGRWFG